MDDPEELEDETEVVPDEWEEFREDEGDPIRVDDLKGLELENIPEGIRISVFPDRIGESIVQKVMRYALSSKFVLIENSEASGHLYEIPHVAKAAECVTVVLQESSKGATWMFEDAYAKHRHWHKLIYENAELERAVEEAAAWAENFVAEFADYQIANLPWLKS